MIGVLKGVCCSLCGVTDPNRHAVLCDIIEEAARVEVGEDDKNVILGYN